MFAGGGEPELAIAMTIPITDHDSDDHGDDERLLALRVREVEIGRRSDGERVGRVRGGQGRAVGLRRRQGIAPRDGSEHRCGRWGPRK